MSSLISEIDVELSGVNQVGIVVEDVHEAMEQYHQLFGIDAWQVYELAGDVHTNTHYMGELAEFSVQIALSAEKTDGEVQLWRDNRTEIELLAPESGPNIYEDHLNEHGEGLHHIAYWEFDDPAAMIQELHDAGIEVMQRGTILGETEYFYFDTRDVLNGVIFETARGASSKDDVIDELDAINRVILD